MRNAFCRRALLLMLISSAAWPALQPPAAAQTSPASGPSEFRIDGAVKTPMVISMADLKKMPRTTIRVANTHNNKTEVYEGVSLAALLKQAGVPQGGQLQGAWMTATVLIAAADNYQVAFSLAELDPGFQDSEVLVADTLDGAPLGPGEGAFKLVAPHDKRPARWVRMLKSITVVHDATP